MYKKIIKWILITISALVLLAGLAFVFLIYAMHIAPFRGEKFSKTAWDNVTDSQFNNDCPRGPVYTDLKNNYLKTGTTRAEVFNLLGKPVKGNLENCVSYDLGMCSGLGFDYDTLDICFDGNAKLIKVSHVQH